MDKALLAVAERLLHEEGWAALRLERIAAAAGVSRATVWRHGLTRQAIEQLLRERLAADYQALMWEPLTMPGTGRERFAAALRALCAVAERNLPLLAHTDTAFHGPDLDAAGLAVDYFAPWLRILEQGQADGSLAPVAEPSRFAILVSDTVLFSYVHLRAHHREYGWTPETARNAVTGLVAHGYLPRV
ncbi:MAG TPA: helix-turn-helix domain-containing protein [Streptosporangiaceae bacterium]|nr:helix-turn-helix domain-containing protein [Streptosporangiaceae bacterium]